MPTPQRVRLLDLIFPRIESLIEHEHTSLRDLPLPISRRLRQRIRALLDLLEILAQDYLNTLALLFDPLNQPPANMAQTTLRRAILLLIWQIQLHDRISATPAPACGSNCTAPTSRHGAWRWSAPLGHRTARQSSASTSTPCCLQPFSRLPTRQRNSASSTIWSGASHRRYASKTRHAPMLRHASGLTPSATPRPRPCCVDLRARKAESGFSIAANLPA